MKVFLDANVYFAGSYSKIGASSIILELIQRQKLEVVTSRLVLGEAERNLRLKARSQVLKSFHQFLKKVDLKICPPPELETLARYESLIHPKDVPVLAAAVCSKADFLITLDRRHFMTPELLKRIKVPIILTPGDFLIKYRSADPSDR